CTRPSFKEVEKAKFQNRPATLQFRTDQRFVIAPYPSIILRMATDTNHLSDLTVAPYSPPAVRRWSVVSNRWLALNIKTIIARRIIQVYSGSNGVSVIKSPTKTVRATYSAL